MQCVILYAVLGQYFQQKVKYVSLWNMFYFVEIIAIFFYLPYLKIEKNRLYYFLFIFFVDR